MKLAVIHLSDIHLKAPPATNSILARATNLRAAIRQGLNGQAACVLVVSGDTAFSGKAAEYDLAAAMFSELLNGIASDVPGVPLHFVIIPGNHDCDFSEDNDVRRIVLKNAASTPFTDASPLTECLRVQKEYRTFTDRLRAECKAESFTMLTDWHSCTSLTIDGTSISIQLLNSAWASQLHESPGRLTFPVNLLPNTSTITAKSAVAITVIHHPMNWFDPNNARELRQYLEETSDLILTGHEHVSTFYSKQQHPGADNEYVEGGVLQESSQPDQSTFNVITLDLEANNQTTETFSWHVQDEMYHPQVKGARNRSFSRNQQRQKSTLPFASHFDDWLHDPGVRLSHPTKPKLLLQDIFIAPDFREVSTSEEQENSTILVGTRLLDSILLNKRVLILGGEVSGKTTLAKVLIDQLKERGIVPVYVGGDIHSRLRSRSFEQLVSEAANNQFGKDQSDRFHQLPIQEKALVLDDYQQLPISAAERHRLLATAAKAFDIVVVLATDEVRLEEFTKESVEALSLYDFKHLELQEFGFAKRSELIRKWYGPSAQAAGDISRTQALFAQIETQLSAIIGEQVVPSYPLFLLVVLQQMELAKNEAIVSGSMGYLYEALVLRQVDIATNRFADIDTNKNYLAELAYWLFLKGQHHISETDLPLWHREYCERYKVSLDWTVQRTSLIEADLLDVHHGMIGFKYPYLFYYFVAEYLSRHISDGRVREQVKTLSTLLHQTQAANIILFLCHRSRDPFIIEAIKETASALFAAHPMCQLDEDVLNLPLGIEPSVIRLEEREISTVQSQKDIEPLQRRSVFRDDLQVLNGDRDVLALTPQSHSFVGVSLPIFNRLANIKLPWQVPRHRIIRIEPAKKCSRLFNEMLRRREFQRSPALRRRSIREDFNNLVAFVVVQFAKVEIQEFLQVETGH